MRLLKLEGGCWLNMDQITYLIERSNGEVAIWTSDAVGNEKGDTSAAQVYVGKNAEIIRAYLDQWRE